MFVLLVPLLLLVESYAYPNGPPNMFCTSNNKRPSHGMNLPQNTCPPYKMDVTSTTYTPKQAINITLRGATPDVKFKGFFITSDTTSTMFNGPVTNTTDNVRTVPYCGMSNTDSSLKSSITITWLPPDTVHIGAIQFTAVVVADFNTFWTNIRTETIKPDLTVYKTHEQILKEMREKASRSLQQMRQGVSNVASTSMQNSGNQGQQTSGNQRQQNTGNRKQQKIGDNPSAHMSMLNPKGVEKNIKRLNV